MSARYALIITSALIAVAPVQAIAKGQPTPVHVIAAVPPVIPRALPDISSDKFLRGCGTHRYRDRATQQCRGF